MNSVQFDTEQKDHIFARTGGVLMKFCLPEEAKTLFPDGKAAAQDQDPGRPQQVLPFREL